MDKHIGKVLLGIVLLVASYLLRQVRNTPVDNTTIQTPAWTNDLDKMINTYNLKIDSLSRKQDSFSRKRRQELIYERDRKTMEIIKKNL